MTTLWDQLVRDLHFIRDCMLETRVSVDSTDVMLIAVWLSIERANKERRYEADRICQYLADLTAAVRGAKRE